MNIITDNEKKAIYVLLGVFVLCLFEYTIFDSKYISSSIEDFLTILILGGIGIYIFTQPRARFKSKDRLLGYFFVWLFVCGMIYLVIYFGCGFIFGFGKNPYKRDFWGIVSNIAVFGSIIILKEWVRNFVINKVERKHIAIYGLIIVLLYTAIEINVLEILDAPDFEAFTIILSQKILPVVALNIFMTYVCYVTGHLPAVLYMLITNIPIWLFDSLPNLEWIVVAVLGIAFPIIAVVSLMETIDNRGKRKMKAKNEPKTANAALWILVGIFCIVVSFFTAGLLNVFPTVLVSNSMSPQINKGDVVIVKRLDEDDSINIDDIILFNAGEFDVVHRVVDIEYEYGTKKYITKGDANEQEDNLDIRNKNIGGVVIAKIPYIGLPRLFIESAEYEDEINIR